MKMKTLLAAAVMFFAFSAAAFAQAVYTVGSGIVTAVVKSGNTEKTGDITFTHFSGTSSTPAGTFTVIYPVPITVPASSMTLIGTGGYAANPGLVILAVVNTADGKGQVVISVPTGVATNPLTPDIIRLSGVRVAVAGTPLTTLSASISTTGNQIQGLATVPVINSIAAGIASVTVATPVGVNGVNGNLTPGSTASIVIKEGFLNAFGVTASTDPTQINSTVVRITLSAPPPPGVTITFPGTAGASSGGWTRTNAEGVPDASPLAITSTTSPPTVWYGVTVDPSTTAIDTLTVTPTVSVDSAASFPLGAAQISATATFAPLHPALNADGTVPTTAPGNAVPRYEAEEVGPATLVNIVGASTTLLVPFASISGTGVETGLAIANSTTDPGAAAMGGITTAVKQSGPVIFYFFPQAPESTGPWVYNTGAPPAGTTLPGLGLGSGGNLPSGSTYTVLAGDLLRALGKTSFQGYIMIVTNFTNAHGLYIVSNFSTFSQGAHMLVVNRVTATRDAPEGLIN